MNAKPTVNTNPVLDIILVLIMSIYILYIPTAALVWYAVVAVFFIASSIKGLCGLPGILAPKFTAFSILKAAHAKSKEKHSVKPWEDFIHTYEESEKHLFDLGVIVIAFLLIAELALLTIIYKPLFYVYAAAIAAHRIGQVRVYAYMKSNINRVGAAMYIMAIRSAFGGGNGRKN